MPCEPKRSHCKLRTAEKMRQVAATEKADEDVALAEDRVRESQRKGQESRRVQQCGQVELAFSAAEY